MADKEGIWIVWEIYMGICEQEANLNPVQICTQDTSEDFKIREYKQRHGEKGI